jgi:hypothetical protein
MTGRGTVVFLGPTMAVRDALRILPDATYLSPAAQGDLYRAARDLKPRAIGLIDGVFATSAAVWHREILWAMAEARIPVLGAASMGALRAAELAAFGMIGIGEIFAAYRSGRYEPYAEPFEDDDEVAVTHAPADAACLPLSAAMVDIRATLAAAEAAGVIGAADRDRLAAALKRLHFPARTWARLAQEAATLAEGPALVRWLREVPPTSQKRRDAEALLRTLAAGVAPLVEPAFVFERAQVWEAFRAKADAAIPVAGPS